jgi:hypothetical protein
MPGSVLAFVPFVPKVIRLRGMLSLKRRVLAAAATVENFSCVGWVLYCAGRV